jgi:hypothetical protein
MPTPTNDETSPATSAPAYRLALESLRSALMAMPEDEVERHLRLDPSAAAMTAEASAKKVAPFRAEIVERFGADAGTLLDELTTIARATRQADIELAGQSPATDLSAIGEEVRAAHVLLMTDADALANRKLIDPARLTPARDVQGYQALVRSTLLVAFVLREHWSRIEEHTPLTESDLDRAESIAQRLSAALGDRDNGVLRAPAAELRTRAVSKLVRHYEELRRMMTFVRWYQDDVDSITPSLWAARGRKSRSQSRGTEPGGTEPGGTEPGGTEPGGTDTPPVVVEPAPPVAPQPNNGGGPFTS